jgi:hypothetical protein
MKTYGVGKHCVAAFVLWTAKPPLDLNKKFDQSIGTSVANLLDSINALAIAGDDAAKR